jgi:hypothetical protein
MSAFGRPPSRLKMSILRSTIAAAIAAFAVAVAVYSWRSVEIQVEQRDAARVAAAQAREQLQHETARLAQLQAEIRMLQVDRGELSRLRAETARTGSASGGTPASATPVLLIEQPHNAGRATPETAIETFWWAVAQGDMKVLADSIAYEPKGKEIIAEIFAMISPRAQEYFGTPEVMMAAFAATQNARPLARFEVLGTEPIDADNVKVSYRLGDRANTMPLRKVDGLWRVVDQGRVLADPDRQLMVVKAINRLAEKLAK